MLTNKVLFVLTIVFSSSDQSNSMASYNDDPSTLSVSQLTETISFEVNINILQSSEFQEFVKKLERAQHVIINMDEIHGMISINGKKAAVITSKIEIQHRIGELSCESRKESKRPPKYPQANPNINYVDPMLSDTIELSVAKNNFLEKFGQQILDKIRKESGIDSASIVNGKLQLSGDTTAITRTKSYLKQTLHEKNVAITSSMKQHLELTCNGQMLKEFSKKYHVGTSLQELRQQDKNKGKNTTKRNLRLARRGHHADRGQRGSRSNSARRDVNVGNDQQYQGNQRGNCNRGQRGKGRGTAHHTNKNNINDSKEGKINKQYDTQSDAYEDNDDDNNSETSDSDTSIVSNFITNTSTMKNFNNAAEKSIEISLCSDSEVSLSKAIAELQSYSLYIESWAMPEDEITFILKHQQRGKPPKNNMSIKERCLQIKSYFRQSVQNAFVHIYVTYTKGMWRIKVRGLKSDVHPAVFKIKSYLNEVVDTEIQIPISGAMAFFLRTKASHDIARLRNIHNIKITTFSPPCRRAVNNDEHNDDSHCLKLIGSVSRIKLAQTEVQNFLETLSEQEENLPCDTWDLSKNISKCIITRLKKIQDSDDYEAIGLVKLYESAIERRQTTPKVTFTVVALNEETADDVLQQCKDIIEGYVVWQASPAEYRVLCNTFFGQKRPDIDSFRQEWDTYIQLENDTKTVIIPARSKIIADEIKEALQNLALGNTKRMDRVSITISIPSNIRRFVNQAIHSILEEGKTQKVFVDSKTRVGLTLHGRSQVVSSIQEKINTIINNVKQKIVTNRIKLPFTESELIRANSYQAVKRIERETNTNHS